MAKARLVSTESVVYRKILKFGPLRMHFQHSGAKLRVFKQTQTSLNNFWLFYSVTAQEYFI